MASDFPACPASLKQIQHYLKTASEHESRDIVVVYWCRLYALQTALKIDKKSDEAKMLLVSLMDWLEKKKKEQADNDAITNELAAQAQIENYALKLFIWADRQDQSAIFNKNVVKSFYTSGMLMDVLMVFGELSEDIENKRKYAKWKAAYIHNCLKSGETPVPGPPLGFDGDLPEDSVVSSSSKDQGANDFSTDSNPLPGASSLPGRFSPTPSAMPPPIQPADSWPSPAVPSPSMPSPSMPSVCPQPSVTTQNPSSQLVTSSGVKLDPAQISKAQKYCKWAGSALNYDDVPEAISNIQKALRLLTTGEDG